VRRFFSRNRDAAIFAYSLDDASLCIYLFGLLKEESCRFYAARLPNTAYHLPETEERRHHLATIEHESIHHLSFLFDIHPELQHAISQRSAIDGPLQHALICGQPLPADHISRKWYKAAGVMIVRGHHPQQEVGSSLMQQALLLRETRYKNKSKREALGDFINCPGGKRDATDTCAEFTALREFYEESFVEHHLTRDFLVSLWTVLLQCPRLVYFLPDCKYLMFVVAVEDLLDVEQCGLDRLGKDNVPAQPPKETSLLWCSLAELYHAKDAFGTIGQPPAKLFHVLSWLLEGVRPAMMKPI
jgi:8-oxo-dGTP pyrophosphatase MutT (NUDIX family)